MLKSFTHPLRIRLYYALGVRGSATATGLAKEVETTAQLAYYHLTRLVALGMVEEDTARPASGRERYWKQATRGFSLPVEEVSDRPDGIQQLELVHRSQAAVHFEYFTRFLQNYQGSAPFREAAFGTDEVMSLTHGQMLELEAELNATLKRFQQRASANPAPEQAGGEDEPTATVMVFIHGFPLG